MKESIKGLAAAAPAKRDGRKDNAAVTQAALREATGFPVLGSVSMNWTDKEIARRRRSMLAFGAAFAALILVYGGTMGKMLMSA